MVGIDEPQQMEKLPPFFKFRNINKYLIDALVNGTMYCARPIDLNDPFDCQVDIKKAAENAISCLSGNKKQNLVKLLKLNDFFNNIQESIKRTGVCCFSLVLKHPLLWSHYADKHKGLCLAYEIPSQLFFKPSKKIEGAYLCVDYGENPLTEWFKKETPEEVKINKTEFSKKLVGRILSIKGKEWEYEKEVRIVCLKEGTYPIPKDCLRRVYFGMNTPKSDICLVKQIIDNAGYSLEYYQIERSGKDFGIKTMKI